MKVHQREDRLRRAGAGALFVTFDHPSRVRSLLLGSLEPRFPILIDEDRASYARWGLGRAPWWRILLDPSVWWRYAWLMAGGMALRGSGRDLLQLGGDFVVASDGTVVYARPQRRDDRPPVGELLDVIDDLASGRERHSESTG